MPIWTLYTDGASGSDSSGAGLILTDLDRKEITYALRFGFPTSNNEAEYETLIAGLELTLRLEVCHLQVFTDSVLVTNHVKGTYEAREELMKQYLSKVQSLQEGFEMEDAGETWMIPIIEYLKDGRLPKDLNLAKKIRIKAPQYSMKQGGLYKKGKAKGQCMEELPNVLWAHRTMAKTGNHCTPFSLVYGFEAVLPPEIGVPTYRIQSYKENKNNADLRLNL
ncbi:reverse transcriptase domain-containing protein [Tanacetum coccineum]